MDDNQQNTPVTGHDGVVPAGRCRGVSKNGNRCRSLAGPSVYCGNHSPDAIASLTALVGKSLGGQALKAPLGLGLAEVDAGAVDLASQEGRRALLSAAARALALGKCTASTATALTGVVRAAAEEEIARLKVALAEMTSYAQSLEQQLEQVSSRGRR
jgi:hypothetical protein